MNHLAILAYHHAYGWTDWLAHVTISAFVHALIYSTVFGAGRRRAGVPVPVDAGAGSARMVSGPASRGTLAAMALHEARHVVQAYREGLALRSTTIVIKARAFWQPADWADRGQMNRVVLSIRAKRPSRLRAGISPWNCLSAGRWTSGISDCFG